MEIVDDDGQSVDDGSVGHIAVVTDPTLGLFHGYSAIRGTARTFRKDGITGDGTKTAMAIFGSSAAPAIYSSAGCRASPFGVEGALIEHPAVLESAVIGKPDPLRGEIVKAIVILADGYAGSDAMTQEIQNSSKASPRPINTRVK